MIPLGPPWIDSGTSIFHKHCNLVPKCDEVGKVSETIENIKETTTSIKHRDDADQKLIDSKCFERKTHGVKWVEAIFPRHFNGFAQRHLGWKSGLKCSAPQKKQWHPGNLESRATLAARGTKGIGGIL